MLRSLRLLQWLSLALVLLLGGAAGAAVVLATRGALDTHRFTIEVMHGVGATDVQVTRLFQRRIAVDALTGSLGGASLAGAVLLVIAAGASFAGELTGGATLTPVDLLILALLPFALTALATWVARTTVLAALRQAAMIARALAFLLLLLCDRLRPVRGDPGQAGSSRRGSDRRGGRPHWRTWPYRTCDRASCEPARRSVFSSPAPIRS